MYLLLLKGGKAMKQPSTTRTLGQAIRDIRRAKRWSARELGERAGLAQSTIYRSELGKAKPQADTLLAIFTAFGPERLARWQESPESFERLPRGLSYLDRGLPLPSWITWVEEPE